MRISIIGAGPAGAMAAVRLARAGADVRLFDHTHPREKPCGGGLTGRALSLVADVVDIGTLPLVVATSAVVGAPATQEPAHVPLIDCGPTTGSSLLIISRAVFDRALVDAAIASGARFVPEKVSAVTRERGSLTIRTDRGTYETDHVIGADGVNSVVRKIFAAPFTRRHLSTAAGYFVHGVADASIALDMCGEQPGYLWSFPRPDHLAVGVCAPAAHHVTAPALRAQSRAWIDRQHFSAGRCVPYAWPIPSVGGEDASHLACSGPGWMLCGDAAGLVDPLTREGIYYALLSGIWAADALAGPRLEQAAAVYADRVRSAIHPELARAARLTRLFFNPVFSGLFLGALTESAPIRRVFTDLVGGVQPYRGLRRRLLGTREWALAVRAIRAGLFPQFAGTMRAVVSPHAMQI